MGRSWFFLDYRLFWSLLLGLLFCYLLLYPYGFHSQSFFLILLFGLLHNSLVFFWCNTFTRFSESCSFLFCKIFQHSLLTLGSHCLFSNISSTILNSLEIHSKHCSILVFFVIELKIADNVLNHFLEFRIFKLCCKIKSSKNQKFT